MSPAGSGRDQPALHHPEGPLVTASNSVPVIRALGQLAHTVYGEPSTDASIVTPVLQLLAESLSVAQVQIARFDGDTLRYERIYGQRTIHVQRGDAIPLADSYCQVMLETGAPALVVQDTRADERFARLSATATMGIRAYTGVPLYRTDGRLYGTLCTAHPEPRTVSPEEPELLALAGRIVMQAIETDASRRELLTVTRSTTDALQASTERYRSVIECSPDAIVVTDVSGTVLLANHQAAQMFGFSDADALVGVNVVDHVIPEDRPRVAAILHERWTLATPQNRATEYRLRRIEGSVFSAEVSSSVLLDGDGKPIGLTVIIRDISERKQFEHELRHRAMHDALTDLPNRALFGETLRLLLESTAAEGSSCAVLLLDLNRFKELNDTFGHDLGDHLLEELGNRLKAACRQSDMVARLGGDEFGILLPRADRTGAIRAAETIHKALIDPVEVDGQYLAVDGSIGIAVYPQHGKDAATLLRRVDIAMYAAKRSHSVYVLYDRTLDRESKRRVALSQALREAIEREQFVLDYQPKVDIKTGSIRSVEALIRWRHPEFGIVSPAEFIPLTEQSGLITPLTRWILVEALHQAAYWRKHGLDLQVAVNLSARSLLDHHIADIIAEALPRAGARPTWLILEITESQIMTDPEHALHALERLEALGVTLALDDFGTGYSSLAYLDTLPAKELKIDRSFVLDMDSNDAHRRIVEATINLAHDFHLRTVAEGVETQRTLELLRRLRCDSVQGYHICRPLPPYAVEEWVRSYKSPVGRQPKP